MKHKFVFIFISAFISCTESSDILDLNIDTITTQKKFRYKISNIIRDSSSLSTNASLDFNPKIVFEFSDSIDLEDLKVNVIRNFNNDTIFNISKSLELEPAINNYGSYDLVAYVSKEKELEYSYIFRDTIIEKDFIDISYFEEWDSFQNIDDANWSLDGPGKFIYHLDTIYSSLSNSYDKVLTDFDNCNELKFKLSYFIDQKNKLQNQILSSRPFFKFKLNGEKIFTVSNGYDGKIESKIFYYENTNSELNISIIKHNTFIASNWSIVPGNSITEVEDGAAYLTSFKSNNLSSFPVFSRSAAQSSTSNSSSSSSTTSSTTSNGDQISDLVENTLAYKIQYDDGAGNIINYGIVNLTSLERNGGPISLPRGSGNYKINIETSNSLPRATELFLGKTYKDNINEFDLYITALKIECN